MRRVALALFVLFAVVGCGGEPEPAPPGPRVLVESQVRAFTDRALAVQRASSDGIVRQLASSPDATGGFYPRDGYRAQVEDWGRNVCSHVIAGVPVEDAFAAAYPRDPTSGSRQYREIAWIAADVLCPTT